VIHAFKDAGTEDVFNRRDTKAARASCPQALWRVAQRKLDQLNAAKQLGDLAAPPGNRLEALKGDRRYHHSIRVNERYRVCFRWTDDRAEAVEIVDYH